LKQSREAWTNLAPSAALPGVQPQEKIAEYIGNIRGVIGDCVDTMRTRKDLFSANAPPPEAREGEWRHAQSGRA